MSYTEYFIEQFNEHHKGANLNKTQIHRMLMILDLESKIETQELTKDYQKKQMFVKRLNKLTNRKKPELLLKEMINLSNTDKCLQ